MARKKKEDRFGDFPRKWAKVIEDDGEFISTAQGSSYEELKQMIVDYNQNIAEFEKDQDADIDLAERKAAFDEAKLVYTSGIKVNQAKARYCSYLIRSLGKPAKD